MHELPTTAREAVLHASQVPHVLHGTVRQSETGVGCGEFGRSRLFVAGCLRASFNDYKKIQLLVGKILSNFDFDFAKKKR